MAQGMLTRGVRERIVNHLREKIISGGLAEGERLSEMDLAKRLSVSRGPIREAFVQLAHEGLLVAQPHRGVRVATSAPNSIRKLVTPIRRTLETYALERVFDDLAEDDFRVLAEILQRMKLACRQGNYAGTVESDIAFHRFLLERTGQPDLLAIWSTIVARIRRHFERLVHNKRRFDVLRRHQELVEIFRTGDKGAAVKALAKHIV
jgi:DNA-binding GntR family transcriptional regulator